VGYFAFGERLNVVRDGLDHNSLGVHDLLCRGNLFPKMGNLVFLGGLFNLLCRSSFGDVDSFSIRHSRRRPWMGSLDTNRFCGVFRAPSCCQAH